MIGSVVGNYRIVERLGDGGMGAVYRAVDEMLDREVAIKVLKPELARNAQLIERFRQEAVALARLNHPRIATLHGLERHDASLLMIMEYVRGDTLEAIVQRSGQIAWPRACELCAAVLDALDHAHDKGVVHRDIKPANVMLSSTGAVKVMDFGIARLMGRSRQTQVGHAVGTPTYMAPEQLRGEEVDGRTDLYAVGAVLFELVTGRMAFEADSDYALMMKQLHDPPPSAGSLVPGVPASLDLVIERAMAKRREDRYPDAVAFREVLEELAQVSVVRPRRTPAPAETRLAPTPASTPAPSAGDRESPPPAAALPETVLAPAAPAAPSPRRSEEWGHADYSPPTLTAQSQVLTGRDRGGDVWKSKSQDRWHDWARDWRSYAIAGALFVAAGMAVRAMRAPDGPRAAAGAAGADSTLAGEQVAERTATGDSSAAAARRRAESAADLRLGPPPASGAVVGGGGSGVGGGIGGGSGGAIGGGGVERGRGEPVPPRGTRPSPPREGEGDRERPVDRKEPPAPPAEDQRTVVDPAPLRPEPPRPPSKESEHESEEGAHSAIRDALSSVASVLSGNNTGLAESLLDGGIQRDWVALMKEGRVSMSVSGAPSIALRGARASAEFDASVNVRSPFGANRRRPARFAAELQRSGGVWRVTAVRALGAVDLK